MTREEATERLKEILEEATADENAVCYVTSDDADALDMAIKALEQRWIPVSERLPKSAGVYIVTREFTDGFECADLTDACYFDGTSTWHDDNRINHGREYVDKKIKAWMPLPEPYKAESKLDGDPIDIDKAVEHYEGTLETLKGIDLEVDG